MVNDVTDDIFRSGVPHAVETNLVTRNAINPRHSFVEGDPSTEKEVDAEHHASQTSQHTGESAAAPSDPNAALHDNIQALDKQAYSDNWQSLAGGALKDNLQSLGKEQLHDNRQAIEDGVFTDNYQSLGASQSIQENKLYLEKKSIKDNRQKVSETAVQRAAPQMPATPNATAPKTALDSQPVDAKVAAGAVQGKASHPAAKIQDDDELRARMEKLKATVRNVSETLSDLDPEA